MSMTSLPLGVDLGTTRLRVVHAISEGGRRRIRAVAVREVSAGAIVSGAVAEPDYVAALLGDAVSELKTSERRCVGAIGLPAATLRRVRFPVMSAFERMGTARFEAARYIDYPVAEAAVRLRRLGDDTREWALGIVRSRTLAALVACLRKGGLRVQAIDDEGCALRRCLSDYEAVLDVGEYRSTLHLACSFESFQVQTGGAQITKAIEQDLQLDRGAAEKRKRILGTAGAGERAKAALVTSLASLIEQARNVASCRYVAVVGNAARLPGLLADLMSNTASTCEFAVSHALDGKSYASEVSRLSAPDWTLAAALARR